MSIFERNERIEALDTVCGIWRPATLLEAPVSPLGPFRISFDFAASKDNVLEEPQCQPEEILPIRKIGAGCTPDDGQRKRRRGVRMYLAPQTRGESMMKATRDHGYTDTELGYKPETLTLLQTVSFQLYLSLVVWFTILVNKRTLPQPSFCPKWNLRVQKKQFNYTTGLDHIRRRAYVERVCSGTESRNQ